MTTEQTPPPPSFLDALVAARRQVGIGLVVAGVVLTALAVWWGSWGFSQPADPTDPDKAAKVLTGDDPDKAPDPDKPAAAKKPARSPDYQVACGWAAALALLSFLSAVWLLTQPPDPVAPATAARAEVLAFGGTVGFLTALFGGLLGYRWYPSLVLWVGGGDAREAKWVLYAFAVFLAGLLVMFASLQLARTEERTNATLRRVLYGFNSVFVGLLLLLLLVAVNVVSFMKLPNTLVTNEAAFTGLSEESKTFLRSLDQPVRVYLILPEGYVDEIARGVAYEALYTDCRGLLSQCEDQSRNFTAVYLSPAFDRDKIAALMTRLNIKEGDRDQLGMLVTVGANEEAHAFIPAIELIEIQRGRNGGVVFQGENRLMTELVFLADARSKQKVYFTQGHGELNIDGGTDPARSAADIVRYLRDRKVTVEALPLDKPGAKVPDDAAVVVIAGLQQTLAEGDPMLGALRDYVLRPEAPGKVLAFLPAFRTVQGRVAPTGLETLFAGLGVDVSAGTRIVSAPQQVQIEGARFMPPDCVVVAGFPRIDISLGRAIGRNLLILQETRQVKPAEAPPGPGRKVTPLLGTGSGLWTWAEDGYTENLTSTWVNLRKDEDGTLSAAKQLRRGSWPVAVAVSEGPPPGSDKPADKPRAVVFGSDSLLIDQPPVPAGMEQYRQQLVSDTLDWLREREAGLGIPPRKLSVFALEKPVEWSSQAVLLGMVTIGIIALGGGVWLSRRR